jgi:16S rRNA (guanine527-N7)-methyltransferase
MDDKNLLTTGLTALSFPAGQIPVLLQKMEQYITELQLFNTAYNLVNTDSRSELITAHILDSLAAVPTLRLLVQEVAQNTPVTFGDIGSGGGLPGIPLAAAFPEYQFSLVERMDKRCAFLENCVAMLRLANVRIIKTEAEQIPSESFTITVFRAFRPLDSHFAPVLLDITKKGGFLAAYKAKKDVIEKEMNSIRNVIPEYKIVPLTVPFLTSCTNDGRERNLVIIRR